MKFNHEQFFSGYRDFLDIHGITLDQSKVDALEFLLTAFESDSAWSDVREIAYAFGTMHVETFVPKTGQRYEPVTEFGGKSYFNKYDGRKDLGNVEKGDGFKFRGRGFCQITGRKNFTKFEKLLNVDLVNNPDLALEPDIAFRIMSLGMHKGLFTGKKLSDYINLQITDYKNARRIINGQDRADEIASYARAIEKVLTASKVSAEVPTPNQQQGGSGPIIPQNPQIEQPPTDTETPTDSQTQTVTADSTGNVELKSESTILGSLEDKASKAGDTAQKAQSVLSKFGDLSLPSILMQVWKQFLGVLTLAVGFFYNNPVYLLISVVLFILAAFLWNESRKRKQAEKFALVGLKK